MSNTYVIQWKSKVNGRAGRGTKQFSREEAEQLVEELNEEYPQIRHEVVPWRPPPKTEEEEQEQPESETKHGEQHSHAHKGHRIESSSVAPTPEFAIR
jgi:hypothetical protein